MKLNQMLILKVTQNMELLWGGDCSLLFSPKSLPVGVFIQAVEQSVKCTMQEFRILSLSSFGPSQDHGIIIHDRAINISSFLGRVLHKRPEAPSLLPLLTMEPVTLIIVISLAQKRK